jgi:hypothetical protein
MFFFLFGKRYPLLRPVLGLAVLVVGLLVHSIVTIVVGAALTVIGVGMAAASLRRRGLSGGKGDDRSLR